MAPARHRDANVRPVLVDLPDGWTLEIAAGGRAARVDATFTASCGGTLALGLTGFELLPGAPPRLRPTGGISVRIEAKELRDIPGALAAVDRLLSPSGTQARRVRLGGPVEVSSEAPACGVVRRCAVLPSRG